MFTEEVWPEETHVVPQQRPSLCLRLLSQELHPQNSPQQTPADTQDYRQWRGGGDGRRGLRVKLRTRLYSCCTYGASSFAVWLEEFVLLYIQALSFLICSLVPADCFPKSLFRLISIIINILSLLFVTLSARSDAVVRTVSLKPQIWFIFYVRDSKH